MAALDASSVDEEMRERKDEWLSILSEFIRTPSENPPGDTTEIAAWFKDLLDEYGIDHTTIAPREEMPNVVASFEGGAGNPEDGRHLVYNGHIDTLHIGEREKWDRDPFSGEIEDGKVHGRGASDMYGGMTGSLAAFIYLFENRNEFAGKVTFTAVSDEETGGEWGAKYLIENHPEYHGDALLSGEPSANRVVRFGERGTAWTKFAVDGEAAAASYQGGTNAIEVLMDYLDEVRRLPEIDELVDIPEPVRKRIVAAREDFDYEWGEGATDDVLCVTSSVGVIEGGKVGAVNVTPESANARVDIRLPIGTPQKRVLDYLSDVAESFPADIEIDCYEGTDPSYSDPEDPIFDHMVSAVDHVRGTPPSPAISLAGTDCRYWRQVDVPAAVYGPTPYNVGNQNEFVYVDDVMEVIRAQAIASAKYMRAE